MSTEKPVISKSNLKGTTLPFGAFLSAVFLSGPALAQTTFRGYEGYMWHGGWIFGPVMMVLLLALIVAAAVFLVRLLTSSSGRTPAPRSDALVILQDRFARGEIDKDEYEERRGILRV